jgi:hypothetical protein
MEAAVAACERRAADRRFGVREHGIGHVRVRPGHHAVLVDLSTGGALVETTHRLLPGAIVEIQIETPDSRTAIRGRVLRSVVWQLRAAAVTYRGAIRFDVPLVLMAEAKARPERADDTHARDAAGIAREAATRLRARSMEGESGNEC